MPPTYKRKHKQTQRLQVAADPELGLPALTPKQEQFLLGLLDGKTPVEAYREAYKPTKSDSKAVAANASRLSRDDKIQQSLRFHQRIGNCRAGISRESHLSELARGRELAYALGQASAGIQAEHYRGRVAGLYNDKLALTIGPSDEMLLAQLATLLGPELAQSIGSQLAGTEPPSEEEEALALPPPLEI